MKVYLDKNVVFHYARQRLFDERVPEHSITLVEQVMGGRFEAVIHEGTIFSLSNFIKYHLKRMAAPQGHQIDEATADRQSRDFCITLFLGKNWSLISLEKSQVDAALHDADFTFEDAIQYQAFVKSKCPFLITWNERDFQKAAKALANPRTFLMQHKDG